MVGTKIFAVFGCLGKTMFANRYPDLALDIESSPYEYYYDGDLRDIEKFKGKVERIRNPDFPQNYVEMIKKNIGEYPLIFIVQSKEVMRILDAEGIHYSVVYPDKSKIEQLLNDAKNRGNITRYVERLENILENDEDLLQIQNTLKFDELIFLRENEYLSDFLQVRYPELFENMGEEKAEIESSFVYHGERYNVEFYSLYGGRMPRRNWSQVYVVGNYKGRVPVVKYREMRENLPGGGVKFGETIEDAMRRELREELNMRIGRWEPLGYQRVSSEDGRAVEFQLRVYAELERIGPFRGDSGGHVVGYDLVGLDELEGRIGYGAVGEYFCEALKEKYGKRA